ncbi:protein of unknown function [Georgfuchsia toluolica]|uniref:Uncharacterized protein n=1 Tax=Georgfuchsia toluolica TaxID=424218 RepID=A0A916J2R6_9PROT|nr:protein of unknown function [Georgfuchsia toluolica]
MDMPLRDLFRHRAAADSTAVIDGLARFAPSRSGCGQEEITPEAHPAATSQRHMDYALRLRPFMELIAVHLC